VMSLLPLASLAAPVATSLAVDRIASVADILPGHEKVIDDSPCLFVSICDERGWAIGVSD
jgi:hypothetical protein